MNPLNEEKKRKIRILLENLTTPQSEFYIEGSIEDIEKILNNENSDKNIGISNYFFGFIPTKYDEFFANEEIFDENFTLQEFIELFEEAKAAKQGREAAAAASIRVEPRLTQSFRDKGTAFRGKEDPRRGGRNKNIKKSKKSKTAKKSKRAKKSKKTKKSKKAKK